MYEMEGPRHVSPRTADPVARARTLRRDTRPADLASQLPGRRLRRDSRPVTLVSRLPDRLVRRDVRPAAPASRSLDYAGPSRLLDYTLPRCAAVVGIQASPVNAGLPDPPRRSQSCP
jgi:hypothetical protein